MALYNQRKVSQRKVKPRPKLIAESLSALGIRKDSQTLTYEDMREGYKRGVMNSPISNLDKGQAVQELDEIVSLFEDYIDNIHDNFSAGTGFFLLGNNDNGKTTLASLWAREAYKHRYDARVVTAEEISEASRTFDDPEAKELIEDCIYKYDFLVIDEMGKETEGKNKYNHTVLERILKARIEKFELPTIVVTNLSPEDFHTRYGNSIYSVLQYLQPIVMTYSLYFREPRKVIRRK